MEQPPPLSPQEMSELAGKEYAQLGQPQTVKVFGILHVVFAVFGFLSCAWALFVAFGGIMVASMLVGVLVACAYPVLTLIFLNKPATKTWFANQPD